MLERQQKADDTDWQSPEPGVISYDRVGGDDNDDKFTIEGFVAWYAKNERKQADRVTYAPTDPRRRKPVESAAPVLTDAQKELMAMRILREKHWAEHQAASGANGIDLP